MVAALIFAACISIYGGILFISLLYSRRRCSVVPPPPKFNLFCGDSQYKGVSIESVSALETSVQRLYAESEIAKMGADQIQITELPKESVLIFPGGKCSEWDEMMSQNLQSKLFNWFQNGGRILGMCAGAYYCSQRSKFINSFGNHLIKTRQIAAFPGKCKGPAYSMLLKVVKVRWEKNKKEGYVAIIGGGYFIPDEKINDSNYTVLASYIEDPAKEKIAVVSCTKGKGRAILSGPHWEFDKEHLESVKPYFAKSEVDWMQRKLQKSAEFRSACMKDMFEELLKHG